MSMSEASGSRQPQPSASDADAEQLFEEVQSRLTQLRMDPLPDKEVATQDTARLRSYNGFLAFLLSAQDGNTKVPSQSLSVAEQLRAQLLPAPHQIVAAPVRTDSYAEEQVLWHAAWVSEYKPSPALRAFTDAVKRYANCDPDTVYARMLPFIQSSGTGKSRMLDEAAKSIFTIPICLRAPGGNGYPPGDDVVWQALVRQRKEDSRIVFLLFLKHVFQEIHERLLRDGSLKDPSAWRQYLETDRHRKDFYGCVLKGVEHDLHLRDAKRRSESSHQPAAKKVKTDASSSELTSATTKLALISAVKDSIGSVARMVAPVLLYFDEAHELVRCDSNAIASLMSALAEVKTVKGLLTVVASTNSNLVLLAPSPQTTLAEHSDRFQRKRHDLIQPWSYFPFKVFNIAPPDGGAHWTPEHARTLSVAAKMGRPLWGAALNQGPKTDSLNAEIDAKELAYAKLTLNKDLDSPPDSLSVRAALICRLHLGIERTSNGVGLASALVASRMATALFVEEDRNFLTVSFPIEPTLAWAAFQIIQAVSPFNLVQELERMTQSALVERRPRGELATKFAFMRAYDHALRQMHRLDGLTVPYKQVAKVPWFSAVALGDFLANLKGSREILKAEDVTGQVKLATVANYSLVLAQWTGCMGPSADVGVNTALQALITHCGVQLPPNMPGADHMLVACKDPKLSVSPDNLLVILSQSKNRMDVKQESFPVHIIDRFTERGVPVIYILHEVSPKDGFNMVRDARPRFKSSGGSGCLWDLKMEGVHADLTRDAELEPLLLSQSEPFAGRGGVEVEHLVDMMPMLCNNKETLNRTWANDEIGFWDAD